MYPENLRYTKTHEWARKEDKSNIATVGIGEYAVKELSDIVYIELPSVGDRVEKDSPFGVIESVKAVFDLNSPVTGVVTEVNSAVKTNPELLQKEPYGQGWMIRIRMEKDDELETLLSAADYASFVKK